MEEKGNNNNARQYLECGCYCDPMEQGTVLAFRPVCLMHRIKSHTAGASGKSRRRELHDDKGAIKRRYNNNNYNKRMREEMKYWLNLWNNRAKVKEKEKERERK